MNDNDRPPLGKAPAPKEKEREEDAEALASGIQSGGTKPGGGPGATVGSIGTGGAADGNRATGDADRNNIDEEVG